MNIADEVRRETARDILAMLATYTSETFPHDVVDEIRWKYLGECEHRRLNKEGCCEVCGRYWRSV